MLSKSFLLASVLFGSLGVSYCAAQNLKTIFDSNQPFALRDATSNASPLLYKAAVAVSANRISEANNELQKAMKEDSRSDTVYEAHDLLANMYFRNGRYRQSYNEIVLAMQAKSGNTDASGMLSITKALNNLPEMKVLESAPASITIEPGEIFLPLHINGKDASFFFDTGANISVIGESTAKELGLTSQAVDGKMGDSSGRGATGLRVAVARDLRIAGLHLQNVPFVVVSDDGEPWLSLPKRKHGIIGIPVLLAMRSLRWSPAGVFEMGLPSQPFDLQKCNLLFHNSNPVVAVSADGKRLEFTLDTGAVNTDFNPAFAKALPSLMEKGVPEKQSIEGLGGKTEGAALRIPSVSLSVGGKTLALHSVHVFTSYGLGTWAAGNIGMDVLKQAHEFTLDFSAMTLLLN